MAKKVAKIAPSDLKWAKSDVRHWRARLFKNTFTHGGMSQSTADWCVRIGHAGRRETFNTETPNADAAAARALKIYRVLVGAGWEAALKDFKPKAAPRAAKPATVGAWIAAVQATADLQPGTVTTYGQSLRQIAAEIEDIGDQPVLDDDGAPKRDKQRRVVLLSRFDYRTGGRDAWASKVDALPLTVFAPAAIQKWKLEYIKRAGEAPDARKRAENSAASLMRCARSLFSPKNRKFAEVDLILPDPLPFAGVKLPKKANTGYQSRIDAGTLIAAARVDLTGQLLRIFILGLLCGLRKKEIDLLMWSQVDFEKGVIRIERTEFFAPKSEDSIAEVDLDAETLALFTEWKKATTGRFVVESKRGPRGKGRNYYRCEPYFADLYAWLRKQGVTARKPLHELRKELGAILASEHGIFAAQSVLRHSHISTTAAYYVDKKRKISAGLGAHLVPSVKPEEIAKS